LNKKEMYSTFRKYGERDSTIEEENTNTSKEDENEE